MHKKPPSLFQRVCGLYLLCIVLCAGTIGKGTTELNLLKRERFVRMSDGYCDKDVRPILYTYPKIRKGQTVIFNTDKHIKADTTLENWAKVRPAFIQRRDSWNNLLLQLGHYASLSLVLVRPVFMLLKHFSRNATST
jgi:hypothetical protein